MALAAQGHPQQHVGPREPWIEAQSVAELNRSGVQLAELLFHGSQLEVRVCRRF